MAKRTLISYSPDTDKRAPVAVFELKAGVLVVSWKPKMDWFKTDLEQNGIVHGGKVLRIADGKAFFDALPLAYSNSSTMYIVDA